MKPVNPKFVLRNHCGDAIRKARGEDGA